MVWALFAHERPGSGLVTAALCALLKEGSDEVASKRPSQQPVFMAAEINPRAAAACVMTAKVNKVWNIHLTLPQRLGLCRPAQRVSLGSWPSPERRRLHSRKTPIPLCCERYSAEVAVAHKPHTHTETGNMQNIKIPGFALFVDTED